MRIAPRRRARSSRTTLIVSLEAIFLATFVLISQNREKQLSQMRDEIETQVNLYQEQELTHVLRIVHRIEKHLGIKDVDEETVTAMECFVDSDGLFRQIESIVLEKSETSDPSASDPLSSGARSARPGSDRPR